MAFEKEIGRVWPRAEGLEEKRKRLIRDFAEENGWEAIIHDPGIRVTFRPKSELRKP